MLSPRARDTLVYIEMFTIRPLKRAERDCVCVVHLSVCCGRKYKLEYNLLNLENHC